MTLILAQLAGDGAVALAGDRLIRQGDVTMTATRPKVWRTDRAGVPLLLGVAGPLRVADVLGHLEVPRWPAELGANGYVRSVLVPAIAAHVAGYRFASDRGELAGAQLVVATPGYVASVGTDLSVIDTTDGIATAGSGSVAGRAALLALGSMQTPAFRVGHAVSVVSRVLAGDVGGGVDVLELAASSGAPRSDG